MNTASPDARPADIVLPDGWDWDRVEVSRALWGIAENMVPVVTVSGVATAWITINAARADQAEQSEQHPFDEPPGKCTGECRGVPANKQWAYTGTQYGGDDEEFRRPLLLHFLRRRWRRLMSSAFDLDPRIHPTIAAALSPVLRDYDRRIALAKENALLAFAYWIEAAADQRTENDVQGLALLTDMRDRARDAVERVTGKPFHNPIYR